MKPPYKLLADGTVVDSEEKIVFFGVPGFIRDIGNGDCCFLCGASSEEKEFNNEHVIPDWVLRRYGLHENQITLPNGEAISYSQYTIPCCEDCNAFLGKEIEEPVCRIIAGGYEAVSQYLHENGPGILFVWLSLIFLKVHLKDKHLRFFVDRRIPEVPISELYDWESLHHIHCIVRSLYTDCSIDPMAIGSFFVVPAICEEGVKEYDYGDNIPGKGILIRLGEIVLISVLNDSSASLGFYKEELEKIRGPLSVMQYREILSHFAFINVNLVERPDYCTEISMDGDVRIKAILPEVFEFKDTKEFRFGDFLARGCIGFIEGSNDPNKDEILETVRNGKYTFLFDENGDFIQN